MTKKYKALLFTLLGIGVACLALAAPSFLRLVEFLGHNIPQKDIRLDYIKGLAWAVFLGLTILIWPVRSQDKKALILIWAVKCFVMLFLMLFFEYHYQTDSFGYFSGARYDISEWKNIALGGPSFPVVFISWLHQHSFFDSFHAAKVTFGMIGLVAIYIFYRAAVVFLRQEKPPLLYILALFPSILFWSSVLGKEPIIVLFVAVYCYGLITWVRSKRLAGFFVMLSGILLVSFMRIWMVPILILPALIVALAVMAKNSLLQAVFTIVLIPALLFYSVQSARSWCMKSIADLPKVANHKLTWFAQGGSFVGVEKPVPYSTNTGMRTDNAESVKKEYPYRPSIKYDTISGLPEIQRYKNVSDVIYYIPKGIFTALFRPLPGEVNNIFGFLAGLEDAFLLILFALALKRAKWRKLLDPVYIWGILLIIVWAAVYGFVAYNLGTVCRYRLQILPIFLGLLLFMAFGVNKPVTCNKK